MRKILFTVISVLLITIPCFAGDGWQGKYMDDLTDVNTPYDYLTDKDIIAWNDTLKEWENTTVAAIGVSTFVTKDQSTPQTITASPVMDWLTPGYLPYINASKYLTNSPIYTDGTNVIIGQTANQGFQFLASKHLQVGTAFNYTPNIGDFAVGNTSANARFFLGQSNSYYGGMRWNYNATGASAYLTVFSSGSIDIAPAANKDILLSPSGTGKIGIATNAPISIVDALVANGSISSDIRARGILSEYYGVEAYGGKGGIVAIAQGTKASPTAVSTSANASFLQSIFYDGSYWRVGALIDSKVSAISANTSVSSELRFYTGTVTGDATLGSYTGLYQRAVITKDGYFGLGLSDPDVLFQCVSGTKVADIKDAQYVVQNSGQYVAEYIGTNSGYAGFLVRGTGAGTNPFVQLQDANSYAWTILDNATTHGLEIRRGVATGDVVISMNQSNNVGIGLTPTSKLTVLASTQYDGIFLKNNASNSIAWITGTSSTNDDAQLSLLSSGVQKVQLNANATSYFNGGNVVIGGTSATRKLQVISTGTQLRLAYDGTYYLDIAVGSTGNVDFMPTSGSTYFDTASKNNLVYVYDYTSDSSTYMTFSALDFNMKDSGTTVIRLNANPNQDSYINNGGNFAIGTTDLDGTPAVGRLTVKGTTNDGSTNILVGRDSDEANVFLVNTDGGITGTSLALGSGAITTTGITTTGQLHIHPTDPATNYDLMSFVNVSGYGVYSQANTVSGHGATLKLLALDYDGGSNTVRNLMEFSPLGSVDFFACPITTTGTLATGTHTIGGATGVTLSAATGVLTIAGVGNTNNENLLLDFESEANKAIITSGTNSTLWLRGTVAGGVFSALTLHNYSTTNATSACLDFSSSTSGTISGRIANTRNSINTPNRYPLEFATFIVGTGLTTTAKMEETQTSSVNLSSNGGVYAMNLINNAKLELIEDINQLVGTANIKGFWIFDQTGATTSITGRDPDGTVCTLGGNASTLSPSVSGLCPNLTMNGTSATSWSVADADKYSFGDGAGNDSAFTVIALVNPVDMTGNSLIMKYNSSNLREYIFGDFASADKINFAVSNFDNLGNRQGRLCNTVLTTDEGSWHCYGATASGGSPQAEAGMKIYRDGIRIDDTTYSAGAYTGMSNTVATLSNSQNNSSGWSKSKYGVVIIINKELTAAEVKRVSQRLQSYAGSFL